MILRISRWAVFLGAMAAFSQALADDWTVVAHATEVEGSYLPTRILFKVDQAAGTCSIGTQLTWNAIGATDDQKIANSNGAFAILATSIAAGKTVKLIGNNSGCIVDFIFLEQ